LEKLRVLLVSTSGLIPRQLRGFQLRTVQEFAAGFERDGKKIPEMLGCKHDSRLLLVHLTRRRAFADSKQPHVHREEKAQMFCTISCLLKKYK
jgi:hypothetical protein